MKLCPDFVEVENNKHLVKEFNCGKENMNVFLHKFAAKHAKKGVSRTMVLLVDDLGEVKSKIAAYYTLSVETVRREDIPMTGLPLYPVPTTLLARLAIDNNFQRKGLGTKSLIYALRDAVKLCDKGMPTVGVTLDVLDEDALTFYKSFNFFYEVSNNPMKLFAPMGELRQL